MVGETPGRLFAPEGHIPTPEGGGTLGVRSQVAGPVAEPLLMLFGRILRNGAGGAAKSAETHPVVALYRSSPVARDGTRTRALPLPSRCRLRAVAVLGLRHFAKPDEVGEVVERHQPIEIVAERTLLRKDGQRFPHRSHHGEQRREG